MKEFDAGLIALGAALNVSIGYLVGLLKLPLYLDSIGTVLISALCGWMYGVVAGIAALIILALTTTPTVIAYAGTAVVVALLSAAFSRVGFLRNTLMTAIGGIIIGISRCRSLDSGDNIPLRRCFACRVGCHHYFFQSDRHTALEKCPSGESGDRSRGQTHHRIHLSRSHQVTSPPDTRTDEATKPN